LKKSGRSDSVGIIFFALLFFSTFIFISCIKGETVYTSGDFAIKEKDFLTTIENLPDNIRENINRNKTAFISLLSEVLEMEDNENYLFYQVDKKNLLPARFEPSDLVPLDNQGFLLNKEGMKIRKTVINSLREMITDAADVNLKIMISSAYRSYKYQKNLYNYYTGIYGEEETARFSAPPGASQHQLGTALDFGTITKEFMDTKEGKWIYENSWKYGFSLSFPDGYESITGYEYEPWHYRYITKPGAILERDYFEGLQHLFLEYLAVNREILLAKRAEK
jgi:D-alanyl-D-alanine carboxypeptidase